MTQSDLTNFKNGIFALNTRRFGFIAEIMIKQIFGCVFSKDKPSDASKTKVGENKKILIYIARSSEISRSSFLGY